MGFEPNGRCSANESVNKFRDQIAARVSEAKAAIVKAKDEFKLYYDHRCVPAPEIKVGDRVWVDASDIKTMCPSPKFSANSSDPFKVVKVVGNGVYKLKLPPCYSQLHPVFLVMKLKLAKPDPFPGCPRHDEPPPVLQPDGDERWEVDEILEGRVQYSSLWYMVRWKGYGPEHDKWVKHSDVFAKDAIDTYYRRYPNAPRRIASAAFDSLSFRRRNRTIRFIRRDAVFQGGGDVRGTPALPAFLAVLAISPASALASVLASALAFPPANAPDLPPARSRWHVLCDQARDHCRYLRTCATG
jgi:hypothetical protein